MKKIHFIIGFLFASQTLMAGEILNQYSGVIFQPVHIDTVNDIRHRILPVQIIDGLTTQITDFGMIDLDQFGFPEQSSMLTIFITDWVRDRVLFADIHQVIIPDYFVLDLRARSVYRPQSDILNQVYGDMYITPDCNYIVYFGRDYNLENQENMNYLQDHNILFTVAIDAATFNSIARLNTFSAVMGTYPPNFYFSGDSAIYIVNPFTGPGNRQLINLALPSLAVQDTVKFAAICDSICPNVNVWDEEANFALLYAYSSDDSIQPAYLIVNLASKTVVSRLVVSRSPNYGAARLSDNAHFVAFQEGQRYLIYDRLFRRHFAISGAGDFTLPGALFRGGIISFYSQRDNAIVDYDLETGRFLRRR